MARYRVEQFTSSTPINSEIRECMVKCGHSGDPELVIMDHHPFPLVYIFPNGGIYLMAVSLDIHEEIIFDLNDWSSGSCRPIPMDPMKKLGMIMEILTRLEASDTDENAYCGCCISRNDGKFHEYSGPVCEKSE